LQQCYQVLPFVWLVVVFTLLLLLLPPLLRLRRV
jgi:hypothetical protein